MTIFERLRLEFGRTSMPSIAPTALKDCHQHAGESLVHIQRHLYILARQAYTNEPFTEVKARILEKFGMGFHSQKSVPIPPRYPNSIKVALDITRREEAIRTACPLIQESSSSAFECRPAPAATQGTSVDDSDRFMTFVLRRFNAPGPATPPWHGSPLPTTP
ncbi:unnamed protein product [Schistocephalus solidus]|uniref:HTH_33 domain-containing protein n=1 Tax=Schistocephalus solidus TaxID=70667 RepID=A0A183SEG1_SCHSO|nr:unnamed protein product [Schistocephalus solidus]